MAMFRAKAGRCALSMFWNLHERVAWEHGIQARRFWPDEYVIRSQKHTMMLATTPLTEEDLSPYASRTHSPRGVWEQVH